MATITIRERAAATARTRQALALLQDHPKTTRGRLAAARTQLNIACNVADRTAVLDAAYAAECIVLEVYGPDAVADLVG